METLPRIVEPSDFDPTARNSVVGNTLRNSLKNSLQGGGLLSASSASNGSRVGSRKVSKNLLTPDAYCTGTSGGTSGGKNLSKTRANDRTSDRTNADRTNGTSAYFGTHAPEYVGSYFTSPRGKPAEDAGPIRRFVEGKPAHRGHDLDSFSADVVQQHYGGKLMDELTKVKEKPRIY